MSKKKDRPYNNVKNRALLEHLENYKAIEDKFSEQVKAFGVPFRVKRKNPHELRERLERLKAKGASFRNNGKSIHTRSISSACEACTKGAGCSTIYLSLMCNRSCYYCFNPNQEEYDRFSTGKTEWRRTLSETIRKSREPLTHLALSGGEPLLHKNDTLEFFRFIQNELKDVHTRLYTAGDLLDEDTAKALRDAGLREIRFSVKLEDSEDTRALILEKIAMAVKYIPEVMVEMPVIPGTEAEMRTLLTELDAMNIFGVNLLEFCFPLNNAREFTKRGFKLKYPPYETLYNYWYAGGLAVDGSEEACLDLLEFALDQGFTMGVHYCSLENKHTGQVWLQNTSAGKIPETMQFSQDDFFLKTGKVFGDDIPKAIILLRAKGTRTYEENLDYGYLQFHPGHIEYLKEKGLEPALSYNVMEYREDGFYARELKLEPA